MSGSVCQSLIIQGTQLYTSARPSQKSISDCTDLRNISLRDFSLRLEMTNNWRIEKLGRQAMVDYKTLLNKNPFLRGAAVIKVDLSKSSRLSGLKHGEALDKPLRVFSFKDTLFKAS